MPGGHIHIAFEMQYFLYHTLTMKKIILAILIAVSLTVTAQTPGNTPKTVEEQTMDIVDANIRRRVIEFVEDYSNYFDNKDIEALQKLFPSKVDDSLFPDANSRFLNRLKQIFRMNDVICGIERTHITSHYNHDDIFGINIHQTFSTNNYSDTGWAFFFIDFRDPEHMQVLIATWQSEEEAERDGVYSVNDFYIP